MKVPPWQCSLLFKAYLEKHVHNFLSKLHNKATLLRLLRLAPLLLPTWVETGKELKKYRINIKNHALLIHRWSQAPRKIWSWKKCLGGPTRFRLVSFLPWEPRALSTSPILIFFYLLFSNGIFRNCIYEQV